MLEHPGYYNCLLNEYPKEIMLLSEKQINLDITRAFPEDEYFHKPEVLQKLKNILLCYSKRNLSIGYVQGFNFIVGRLLKFIPDDDEKVFWIFVQIIENILPLEFYSEMAGVMTSVDILLCLFKQMYIPDLLENLNDYVLIYLKNIIMQWFLSLFVINFPFDATTVVWDTLFLDKKVVLFKLCISLVKLIKDDLLKIHELEEMKNFMQDFCNNFRNINYLKYALIQKQFEFNEKFIEYNYSILITSIIESINNNNKHKIKKATEKMKERNEVCDLSWPFCIYDCETYYKVSNLLVLKQLKKMNIIWNYFNDNYEKDIISLNSKNPNHYETLLIERLPHICEINNKNVTDEESCSSTGTEKSFEQENYYYSTKSKYKNRRMQGKCISSIQFIKEQNKKNKTKLNNNNDNNNDNFEQFISKLSFRHDKFSKADSYWLIKNPDFEN